MIVRKKSGASRYIQLVSPLMKGCLLCRLQPLEHDRFRIPKSRYDSVDLYISEDWRNRPEYNDQPIVIDECTYNRLRQHGKLMSYMAPFNLIKLTIGIDDLLSKHLAHLFIRDPLVVFSEMIDQDDEISNDHFEVRAHCVQKSRVFLTKSIVHRIFSPLTGRRCASSPHPQTHLSAGGWSFVAWRSK